MAERTQKKLEYTDLRKESIYKFPPKWSILYYRALVAGSNFTGRFLDRTLITPGDYEYYFISDNNCYSEEKEQPDYVEFISPSFCKINGQEYKTHISSAHEVLLPSHIIENQEPMYVSPDFNWTDHRGYETPYSIAEDYFNHVSKAVKELMTADMRQEKAIPFTTPVYFSASALGPVLSAEIWTWTGLLIPFNNE